MGTAARTLHVRMSGFAPRLPVSNFSFLYIRCWSLRLRWHWWPERMGSLDPIHVMKHTRVEIHTLQPNGTAAVTDASHGDVGGDLHAPFTETAITMMHWWGCSQTNGAVHRPGSSPTKVS